jgi:hypothetical protein
VIRVYDAAGDVIGVHAEARSSRLFLLDSENWLEDKVTNSARAGGNISLFSKFRFRRCSSQNKVPLAAGRLHSAHNPARLWRNWYLRCRDIAWSKRWVFPAWRFFFFCFGFA